MLTVTEGYKMIHLHMVSECGRFECDANCEPEHRAFVEAEMRRTLADRVRIEDGKTKNQGVK